MKEITITQIARTPSVLKKALKKGPVRIVWKEQKPGGKVLFSAITQRM